MGRVWGSRGGADGMQEEAGWLLVLPGDGGAQLEEGLLRR